MRRNKSALLPIAISKADLCPANGLVRFTPKADIAVPRFDNPAKNFWKFKLV
jgi:hypothetical protein